MSPTYKGKNDKGTKVEVDIEDTPSGGLRITVDGHEAELNHLQAEKLKEDLANKK